MSFSPFPSDTYRTSVLIPVGTCSARCLKYSCGALRNHMRVSLNEQEQFILQYLTENGCGVDACNTAFHDQFHARFGGKRKHTYYGAQLVYKAQKLLAAMASRGQLTRHIVVLAGCNQIPGMPNWVYSYTLPEEIKNKTRSSQPRRNQLRVVASYNPNDHNFPR